jgi:uncharacterized membrane protein (UPF0136 family)
VKACRWKRHDRLYLDDEARASMNNSLIGHVTLVIYAVLLAVGGVMGFVKGKSKASLISGVLSAVAAVVAVVIARMGYDRYGLWLGMTLAIVLFILFGYRYTLRWKFMPSGMLAVVSLVVLGVLILTSDWMS